MPPLAVPAPRFSRRRRTLPAARMPIADSAPAIGEPAAPPAMVHLDAAELPPPKPATEPAPGRNPPACPPVPPPALAAVKRTPPADVTHPTPAPKPPLSRSEPRPAALHHQVRGAPILNGRQGVRSFGVATIGQPGLPRGALHVLGVASAILLAVVIATIGYGHRRAAARGQPPASETKRLLPVPVPAATAPLPPAAAPLPPASPVGAIPAATCPALPALAMPGLQTRPTADGLLIVFDHGVFARRTTLSGAARDLLKQLGDRLRPALADWRLEIVGHTDPDPVRGNAIPDNQALGEQRARAVRAFLAADGGLPAAALAVSSSGDTNTPYPNTTADLRRKNRTVTIRIIRRP